MAKLPKFRSEEEEAEFWAHHDLTEFEEDLEPVEVEAVRGGQVISLRLPPRDLEALKRLAAAKGVGYSTLLRMWVRERLAAEQVPPAGRRRGRRPPGAASGPGKEATR